MVSIRKKRIVIDTNCYISATINKASRRTLYQLLISPHHIVLYNEDLIAEYKAVITRD